MTGLSQKIHKTKTNPSEHILREMVFPLRLYKEKTKERKVKMKINMVVVLRNNHTSQVIQDHDW